MTAPPTCLLARPDVAISPFDLARETPDTALADRFDGEPMVQSFRVALPGAIGRCWIATAEALRVPQFGRMWVAATLEERIACDRWDEIADRLCSDGGLRLRAPDMSGDGRISSSPSVTNVPAGSPRMSSTRLSLGSPAWE